MSALPRAVDRVPQTDSSDLYLLRDSDPQKDGHPPRPWQPFFLRRSTILSLIASFLALLGAIVALYCYAARGDGKQGIETQGWKFYYLWTYGPTAVFMVVGAFWEQVEYRACQLTPWLLMSRGPVAASDGLLLDYLSPWNVASLYRSLRRRHYLVSLVIVGTLLVHGLAIVSTNLFELRDLPIKRSTSLRLINDFNFSPDYFKPRDVTTIPHMRAKGIALNGSDVPFGIVANHVFSPFQDGGPFRPDNFTMGDQLQMEAEVDVLTVKVQCEKATLEVSKQKSEYTLSMKSGYCSTGPLAQYYTQNVVSQDPAGYFEGFPAVCDEGKGAHDIEYDEFRNAYWRIWAYISHQDPNGLHLNVSEGTGKKVKYTAGNFSFTPVLCTPYLDIARVPVKLSRSSDGIFIITDLDMKKQRPLSPSSPSTLDVNAGALLYGAWISMLKAEGDGWSLLGPRSEDREAFFDAALLSQELGRGLQSRAVQVARDYLLQPVDRHTGGTAIKTESRLFVRRLSFGLMIGFLSALIIVSIVIVCVYLPLSVCCRDPSSIGGLATILARSPELMATLQNMNLKWPSEMKELLAGRENRTNITAGSEFQIEVHDKQTSDVDVSKTGTDSTPRWWRPVSARPPVYTLTFAFPVAVIVTIEVLLHISNTRGGITPVEGRADGRDQPWAYVPAFVMFCVRIPYHMMESTYRTFQPYQCLARGRAHANASVLENQGGKITAWAILDSLRKRQWSLAASAVALLLAAALPITVSGLYAVDNLPYSTDISLVQRSTWDISSYKEHLISSKVFDLLSNDIAPGKILYLNMSYPQGTYADLAFPTLWTTLAKAYDNVTSELAPSYIEARLTAWRPDLNCDSEIPASDYKVSWSQEYMLRWDVDINSTRGACSFSLQENGIGADKYFSSWFNLTRDDTHKGNPADCPTLLYLFGNRAKTHMLKCRPQIQEVDVDIRFEPESLKINTNYPPSIVPWSARPPLEDFMGYSNGAAVPLPMLPAPGEFSFDLMAVEPPVEEYRTDLFTTAAIWGAGGTPADELFYDLGKLSAALTRIYGIVIAQRINDNWRIPLDSDTTAPTADDNPPATKTFIPAKLISHGDYLVQGRLSTRLLDAFLGSMILLAITSMLLMNTKNVLPKNPCSIAAVASLLAGSRILGDPQIIPRGAEWWDDKELARRGVFVGWRFSMGWWVRKRQGVGVGVGADERRDGEGVGKGEAEGLLEEERVFGIDLDGRDRESG